MSELKSNIFLFLGVSIFVMLMGLGVATIIEANPIQPFIIGNFFGLVFQLILLLRNKEYYQTLSGKNGESEALTLWNSGSGSSRGAQIGATIGASGGTGVFFIISYITRISIEVVMFGILGMIFGWMLTYALLLTILHYKNT